MAITTTIMMVTALELFYFTIAMYIVVLVVVMVPFRQFWEEQPAPESLDVGADVNGGFLTRGKLYKKADSVYTSLPKYSRPAKGEPKGFIIVQQDYLPEFYSKYMSLIKTPVKIGVIDDPWNSIDTCTKDSQVMPLVENPLVTSIWVGDWCGNLTMPTKTHHLPIGIATRDEAIHSRLYEVLKKLPPCNTRPIRVMASFKSTQHSHMQLKSGLPNDRVPCYNALKDKKFVDFWPARKDIVTTWEEHAKYAFELCPQGNNITTHRFWECVLTGTIPIVRRDACEPMYREAGPVLFVDNWNEVTLDLITDFYNKHASECKIGNEIGMFDFWYNRIMNTN